VYLLYVDESGRAFGSKTRHFVVAGVAVHEEDAYPLAKSLRPLQRRHVGVANADLELHATELWGGRDVWAHVPIPQRRGLLRAVFGHLGRWVAPSGREPRYFGAVVRKESFPGQALERGHAELFGRFDDFVNRLHSRGDSHRSLVVADNSSYEHVLQTLMPRWKAGDRVRPLHSLIEVPLYVDSTASRLVQVADFVAWAMFQYYENGHGEHLQRLHGRIDAASGIQHGLVHLRRAYQSCACVPCSSRRLHVISSKLPALT
jgi:hypothetical protein